MSTKRTLACGDDFHFYEDYYEPGFLFLKQTSPVGEMTMKIPLPIWETIRQYKILMDVVDLSDEQICDRVKSEVDERISDYENASTPHKGLFKVFGSEVYGLASDPRESQLEAGFKFYAYERTKQQEITNLIKKHKVYIDVQKSPIDDEELGV